MPFYGVAHKRVTHVDVVILCCSFMPGFYNHLGIAEEHKGVTTGYKATSSGSGADRMVERQHGVTFKLSCQY